MAPRFFSERLFSKGEQQSQEAADYELILAGIRDHYRPIGFMEDFRVEKIATELLRSARLLSFEQKVFGLLNPFKSHSVDGILRYQATNSRQLAQDIEELERHQEIRKAKSSQDPPSDAEADNPPDEQNEMEEAAKEDPLLAGSDLSPSENYGTNPTPTQPLGNAERGLPGHS